MLSFNLPPKLFFFAIVMLLAGKSKTYSTDINAKKDNLFKSVNELVYSASAELIPKDTTKIDHEGFMNKLFNLLDKHAIGVLCKEKIQIKMSENFQQLYENFCSQLKEGKSIKEAARNWEKVAKKKEFAIDTTIFGGIRQKIQILNFLNAKNKDGMEIFVGHFVSAINSFLGMIKANKLPFVIIANANNKNGRKSRRLKRDDDDNSGGDTSIYIDTSSGNSGGGDLSCCGIMVAGIILTITFLCLALYYFFHYHLNAHRFDFFFFAILGVIFLLLTSISCFCCVQEMIE